MKKWKKKLCWTWIHLPYSKSFSNIHFSKFFLVPELHGKNKPFITYVGDSTVLICKCQDCFPLNWTWYFSNESAEVRSYFFDNEENKNSYFINNKIITDSEFPELFILLLSCSLACIHKESRLMELFDVFSILHYTSKDTQCFISWYSLFFRFSYLFKFFEKKLKFTFSWWV